MRTQVYGHHVLGTWCCSGLFSYSDPAHLVPSNVEFTDQLKRSGPKVLSTASTAASCSVAMWRCRCGWCSTTWESSVLDIRWPPCWLPVFAAWRRAAPLAGMLSDKVRRTA